MKEHDPLNLEREGNSWVMAPLYPGTGTVPSFTTGKSCTSASARMVLPGQPSPGAGWRCLTAKEMICDSAGFLITGWFGSM